MYAHQKGWFTEIGAPNGKNVALSLKVKEAIHSEQSKYQKIDIFSTETFGKCLALDDAIQCTEIDEFAYQEMISFLPLNSHPNPKNVLIVGGGDGGVAREVLKHPCVEKLIQCEIDDRVVELSKKHFPTMACSFNDPKLELIIGDGYKYVQELEDGCLDVIITDSSDPKGPAECLFKAPYYEMLHKKLRSGGIICCQAESIWFDLDFIKSLVETNRKIFKTVAYASILTCTYPGGQIGFLLASKDEIDFRKPIHKLHEDKLGLKYYDYEIHQAAFVLPRFVQKKLQADSQSE